MNNPQCSGGRPLYRLLAIQLATSHLSKCLHVCTTPWGVFALVLWYLCSTLLRSPFLQRRFTTDFNQNKAIDQIDKDESVPSDLIRVSRVSHPVEVGQGFGKIWNPCASSNHLGVQVIQSQKAWAIWRCKLLCMYCMYGFACHNLRIPITRRMSRLIKADPFRSSYPPTGHPFWWFGDSVHPSSSLSKSAVFRPHGQQQLAKDGWIAALAAWLNNLSSLNWVESEIKDYLDV